MLLLLFSWLDKASNFLFPFGKKTKKTKQTMTTNKWVMKRRSQKTHHIHSLKRPFNIRHHYIEKSIIEWRNREETSGGWCWNFLIQRLWRDNDSRSLPPTGTSAERAWNAARFPDVPLFSVCRSRRLRGGEGSSSLNFLFYFFFF